MFCEQRSTPRIKVHECNRDLTTIRQCGLKLALPFKLDGVTRIRVSNRDVELVRRLLPIQHEFIAKIALTDTVRFFVDDACNHNKKIAVLDKTPCSLSRYGACGFTAIILWYMCKPCFVIRR